MSKIIVTPIDMAAPGSYGQRKRVLRAFGALQDAQESGDVRQIVKAFDALEAVVIEHAETDDGAPIGEALEQASAEDFDALLGAIIGTSETVPNPSSAS